MSAIKNVMKNNYRNMELNEYLELSLKDSGYGGAEIQKTPIGTKLTLFVTRPGLVIGRKGSGIKDLTMRLEQQFGLTNPQISVMEISTPELNPKIMANRICQLVERGTAFRRAALWTINTIMESGALGVEVSIAGKLRSERSHFEKHHSGIIPKSGQIANRVVKIGMAKVLTKMGLMGIQVRIALKEELPQEFQLFDEMDGVTTEQASQEQPKTPDEIQGDDKADRLDKQIETDVQIQAQLQDQTKDSAIENESSEPITAKKIVSEG